MMNSVKSGMILKDVSMEVHSGEVLAILGSKGKKSSLEKYQSNHWLKSRLDKLEISRM